MSHLNDTCMKSVEVIKKLRGSLDNLEKSVVMAKTAFCKQEVVSTDVLRRIVSYEEAIAKQKGLADKLIVMLERGKSQEAVQLIKVINGFSAMIFEDANDLIQTISGNMHHKDTNQAQEKVYM